MKGTFNRLSPCDRIEHVSRILNVRIAQDRDLSTRARIRDAAVTVFGEQGFSAGVRAIAAAAGVSPGLVNHHFGSKEGLRAECDAHVLEIVRIAKSEFLKSPRPAGMIQQLAEIEHYAPLIAYIVRSFQAGGALADSLFERMVANTEQYLADGVAAGTLRPSRDPAARARYVTLQNLGGMLLYFQLHGKRDGGIDYGRALHDYSDATTFPSLELYTEGMLTDSSLFDALVEQDSLTDRTAADQERQ